MLLFKLGSFFFKIAVYMACFFNQKAKLAVLGRKKVFQVLNEFNTANKDSKIAWFHCASYGEFEQGRPIIEAYRKSFPSNKIVLTFFSPSGYEAWKDYKGADLVTYLPFDSKKNARTFLQTLRPEEAFFVKYEFSCLVIFFILKIIAVRRFFFISINFRNFTVRIKTCTGWN